MSGVALLTTDDVIMPVQGKSEPVVRPSPQEQDLSLL